MIEFSIGEDPSDDLVFNDVKIFVCEKEMWFVWFAGGV